MNTNASLVVGGPARLLACLWAFVCLVLGALGLVLPIIPGVLFLALGVLIVARHFPSVRRWLRRMPPIGRHMDRADRFLDLSFWRKVQVGALLCLKMFVDGIAFVTERLRRRRGSDYSASGQ